MKTTFFGLSRFQNSIHMQTQVLNLVEQTGFPAVMGFEFYPVLVVGQNFLGDVDSISADLSAKGFEVIRLPGSLIKPQAFVPGQLVIYPVIPVGKLKILEDDVIHAVQEATLYWLQKYGVQAVIAEDGRGLVVDGKGQVAVIVSEMQGEVCRAMISISLSNALGSSSGFSLDLKSAFDEWNLYFTSSLLKVIPGA